MIPGLSPELLDAAKAIGLLDASGDLAADWFVQPIRYLSQILSEPGQRAALLDLLDVLFPPAAIAGAPADEKWHPLLGDQSGGGFYFTVRDTAGNITLGAAGDIGRGPGTTLRLKLPAVSLNGGISAVAGTADGPLSVELRVPLPLPAAGVVPLAAVRVTGLLTLLPAPAENLQVVLEGLDLDGTGPRDTALDVGSLDQQALQLVLGLVRRQLDDLAAGASGEAKSIADHLLPLLGIGGGSGGLPPFPFEGIAHGPAALQQWLLSLLDSGKISDLLGHLAGLLGSSSAVTPITATGAAPRWTVRILDLDGAGSGIDLTLTDDILAPARSLKIGVSASFLPAGGAARIDAGATLVAIPLAGTAPAGVLPDASLLMAAPGGSGQLVSGTVGSLRAGARWTGGDLVPLLELLDVTVAGTHYDKIDLTNADSVVAAAKAAVAGAITSALGSTGAGAHLAALAGLIPPAGDSLSPQAVDLAALAANPAAAIGAFHRAVLLDGTHNWSFLLAEVGSLLGITGAAGGSGKLEDPWRIPIASSAPLEVDLAAWNAQTSGNAADPQQLRLGLRAAAAAAPWQSTWTAELLAFDLPASGSGTVSLMAGQHARFSLQPVPAAPALAGLSLAADAVALAMDWTPGAAMSANATIENLQVTFAGSAVTVPSVVFPPPAGFSFDVNNPGAAFGVSNADAELLVRGLLARGLSDWAGGAGAAVAALLGLGPALPGLPVDLPVLSGAFLADPLPALRAWLGQLAAGLSASGPPFLPAALAWLQSLVANRLPAALSAAPPPAVTGAGTYDDPWSMAAAPRLELLAWLEPAGPPAAWSAALAARVSAATTFTQLVQRAAALTPEGADPAALAAALDRLTADFEAGDGVVPIDSQVPAAPGWTAGTPLACAHPLEPQDPSAIAQIRAQLDAWNAGPRAVLLLGPAFSDHTIWNALLAPATGTPVFDLRVAGADPLALDLTAVSAAADYYTADLQDDGTNDLDQLSAQIGRVVDRVRTLRGGLAVTLVAHSTAGVAARAFTAANPTQVRGLITLGTPHAGAGIPALTDADVGTALRLVQALGLPLAAGPVKDAVDHLLVAMDGYLPAAGAGTLPVAAPYPLGSFAGGASVDTAGVPALAIGSSLSGDPFQAIRGAAAAATTAPATAAAPTHLGFGLRTTLSAGQASVRADAFRVALAAAAPEPARPERALTVLIDLTQPGGWLVGSATSDVRIRRAELGAFMVPGHVTPIVRLDQAAFHGPAVDLIELGAAEVQPLLGALLEQVTLPADLLAALTTLGIAVTAPRVGLSADAFSALSADALAYLAPRVRAAVSAAGGLLGLPGPIPGIPGCEVYLTATAVGLRAASMPLGAGAALTFDARIGLVDFQPGLDLALTLGAATLTSSQAAGTLTLAAPPWLVPLTIVPAPAPAALAAVLEAAVPRLLLASGLSALLEAAAGPLARVSALDALLADPGAALAAALDGPHLTQLLQTVSSALGNPPGPGLALPGGFEVTASGTNPLTIQLATTAAIGGALSITLGAAIDSLRHVSPSGTLSLHVALPGSWGGVTIAFGFASGPGGGVTLDVTPDGGSAIRLLPGFSGLGALAGAAAALLPAALDELAAAVPASTVRTAALDVAQALGLYETAGGFAAHAEAWKALSFRSLTASVQTAAADAVAALFQAALPAVSVTASGTNISIAAPPFSAAAGWDSSGPSLTVKATALKVTSGGVTADVTAGYAAGSVVLSATLGLNLQSSLGLAVVPQLQLEVAGGRVALSFLPLGAGTDSTLAILLAPSPGLVLTGDAPQQLARKWLLPIAADLLVSAEKANFGKTLWPGGPTVQSILEGAGIVDNTGALVAPLPGIQDMAFGALQAIAAGTASITAGDLTVGTYKNASGFGLTLQGTIDIGSGGLEIVFGDTDFPYTPAGLSLQLFGADKSFQPSLGLTGIGVAFAGDGDSALVNTSVFRLGSAAGYLFATVDLTPGLSLNHFGGGIKLGQLGLPLAQLGSGNDGGNPVAASLLSSDGGASAGDTHPVNPGIDVIAWVRDGAFDILFQGSRDPVWIAVHSSFGPIYIDKVGVAIVNGRSAADLLVDGSVKLAGFQVEADELGLTIPFASLLNPETWALDLAGLALSFAGDGISIAGGLAKNTGPNGVEYDGVLTVDLAGRGFSIVGGYARPNDALGGYTSLFLFVSLPITLGGPPFFFVTGLGGGGGYNRELQPPLDLSALPSFPLVAAIDDDSLANDPMSALAKMAAQIPSRRGSYWLAAGLRFSSFVVVNTVAVVYVALDRGFEVTLLGLSRMQLPAPGIALASVELALKARFSSAENVLSVQAQLTDNSYLLSPDCQLTGGFAFFLWFDTGKFVLTLGGYHPAFVKPPEFPDVPRLGFNWSVSNIVVIKGGAYFALTSSAVMAGGSLNASAGISGVRAWFLAYADLLICWEPFHYDVQIGVQVGISVRVHICFFGCVNIELTLSRGASVHIIGPPLHGEVTVDAYVTSITIPFGPNPNPKPSYLGWDAFAAKYLVAGDPNNTCVGLRITGGLAPPEPPGAQPTAGSAAAPWQLVPEFAFSIETRMPASGYTVDLGAPAGGQADQNLYDLAPMHQIRVGSELQLTLRPAVTHPAQFLVTPVFSNQPEATWRWSDPDHQAAAANLIRAMTGLSVQAVAILLGKSALIPISTLVTDDVKLALPLPFAGVAAAAATLQGFGVTAEGLAAAVAAASTAKTLAGAASLLSGTGVFADARAGVGTPAAGLSAVAVGALESARSAPPLLAPITTGLSMKPVGLAAPPQIFHVPAVAPVVLAQPRLHSVLQSLPQPVSDVPPPARTTVANLQAALSAPRTSAPRLQVVPGARLAKMAPPTAPRPTAAAVTARSLRNPEVAALVGTAHARGFADAGKLVLGNGVALPAGTTHFWELPGVGTATLTCAAAAGAGAAAVRVTSFNRGLQVIDDRELATAKTAAVQLPAGATAVAVTGLGRPGAEVAAGFGAASFASAPPGGVPAVGWQAGNLAAQIGPSTLLARGAVIALPVTSPLRRNGQSTSYAMTRVAAAVVDQPGVETWLPAVTPVVMVLLDQQDAAATLDGDLGIAVRGGTLAGAPVAVAGGTRIALLYDVTAASPAAPYLAVAVASRSGWRLSGVVGLHGSAVDQAVRMHGGIPPQIVPDGPLTADGQSQVSLRIEAP